MPRPSLPSALLIAFALLSVLPARALADSRTSEAARKIYQAHQDALVVITAEIIIDFVTDQDSLPSQERKAQTLGTIIHPKGLIMLSSSAINLSIGMTGQRGRSVGKDEFVTVTEATARYPRIQVNLSDGSEYFATLVDESPELDLAFILVDPDQLAKRNQPLPHVSIANKAPEGSVRIADEVIGLSRSSPVYAYIPSVIPGFVTAISKREQTYYVTTAGTAQGIPLFDLEGRFVGITVQRIVDGQRTNLLGTLAASTVLTRASLVESKRGLN